MSTILQTQYQYPNSATTGDTTGNQWENPSAILFPDDDCASSNPNQASDITAGNFSGISLPQDAVITGIAFRVRMKGSGTVSFYAVDNTVSPAVRYPYTTPFSGATPDLEYYDFGGDSYLFGTSWTPDMINNLRIQAVTSGDISVDIVEANAFYYVPTVSPDPTPTGDYCLDCNSQIQALPIILALDATADDRYFWAKEFNYPNGQPITMADLGACGGAIDITLDQGIAKGNGNNFMENAKIGGVDRLNGLVRLDTLNPAIFRGLDFKTPYGPVTGNRSSHGAGSEIVISNNAPFYERFVKGCQAGFVFSKPITVQDEGTTVATAVDIFNFKGPAVSAEVDSVDPNKINVTVIDNPTTTDPTQGATGSGTTGTSQATTLTIPRTITTENLLRVAIDTQNQSIASVMDNGSAMTLVIDEADSANDLKAALYQIINPAVGTHNIVITLAVSSYISAQYVAWNDADTANPTDGTASAMGSSAAPALSVTTTQQNTVIQDAVATKSNPTSFSNPFPWTVAAQIPSAERQGATSIRKVLTPGAISDAYAISPSGPWVMVAAGVRGTLIPTNFDGKILVDSNDDAAGYLASKISFGSVGGTVVATPSVLNPGASEVLHFNLEASGGGGAGVSEQNIGGFDSIYNANLTTKCPYVASFQNGSVLFSMQISTAIFITRYARDVNTGLYRKTHAISAAYSGGGPTFQGGIAIDEANGFVYVPVAGFRYNAADLTGATAITGFPSGSACCYYSPGVYLSITFNTPNWNAQLVTLSGTTFTAGSYLTGFADSSAPFGIQADTASGNIYIVDSSGDVQVFTLSGTALTQLISESYAFNGMIGGNSGQPYGIGFMSSTLMTLAYQLSSFGSGTSNNSILLKSFTRPA